MKTQNNIETVEQLRARAIFGSYRIEDIRAAVKSNLLEPITELSKGHVAVRFCGSGAVQEVNIV